MYNEIVTTPTQLQRNLNCSWRLDTKMTEQTTPPPHPPHRNLMSAIAQLLLTPFWPNLNRFQLSLWHFLGQHLSWRHLSISVISQLLLTLFWPNCKSRLSGQSLTYTNCHSDICPSMICPGEICQYQKYLSCYWINFATLGSILDSQLSWESGKFQLARWSHNMALLSWNHLPTHPLTCSPSFSNT